MKNTNTSCTKSITFAICYNLVYTVCAFHLKKLHKNVPLTFENQNYGLEDLN